MLTNDVLDQWDRENFFHPSTHLAQHARGESPSRIVTTGKGVFIEDRDGNRLLDAFAGLYCVNVGCLDGVPSEVLSEAPVRYEDGASDQWERPPTHTRHL